MAKGGANRNYLAQYKSIMCNADKWQILARHRKWMQGMNLL